MSENLKPLVAVLARQREAATNTAAEQEARALVAESQAADLRAKLDEADKTIAELRAKVLELAPIKQPPRELPPPIPPMQAQAA